MANVSKFHVKQEVVDAHLVPKSKKPKPNPDVAAVIELSSSDSDSDSDSELEPGFSSSDNDGSARKRKSSAKRKRKSATEDVDAVLPLGFLDPLPSSETPLPLPWRQDETSCLALPSAGGCVAAEASVKQFWKAGEYEGTRGGDWDASNGDVFFFRLFSVLTHV